VEETDGWIPFLPLGFDGPEGSRRPVDSVANPKDACSRTSCLNGFLEELSFRPEAYGDGYFCRTGGDAAGLG
jgi:hypothetical protein